MIGNWAVSVRVALALGLAGALAVGLAGSAWAADFRSGDIVVIETGEVIDDDLFVTAGRVEMNGTVKGDLVASGAEVIVNGTVEGSLAITGQLLTVNGDVAGSVYGGGFALTVGPEAQIGRNLYFGGFSLTTEPGSTVGRDLYAGGYQALLDGEVARSAAIASGALELNGKVGGDVRVEVAEPNPSFAQSAPFFAGTMPGGVRMVTPGLRVGDEAEIGGDLSYTSSVEQPPQGGAIEGDVIYATPAPEVMPAQPVRPRLAFRLGQGFSRRLGEFVALLIVGGLLVRFWPEAVRRVTAKVQERPLPSAGWGCLVMLIALVGAPLVAIAIFIVALVGGVITFGQLFSTILGLGGATLGLAVTIFLFVLALVTKAIVAYFAGRSILTRIAPQTQTGRWANLWSLVAGALIYEVLRSIPGLGWLLAVAVTLVGLGAIYIVAREWLRPPTPLMAPSPRFTVG